MKNKINLPGFTAEMQTNAIIPAMMQDMSGTDKLLCMSGCLAQWSACMASLTATGLSNSWQKAYCDQRSAECSAICRNANFGFGWGRGSLA